MEELRPPISAPLHHSHHKPFPLSTQPPNSITTPAPQYLTPTLSFTGPLTALNEVYDWLTEHGVERRAPPSMRLRFGKRDMGWQVAQRSMPSLRLRFGKRTVDQAEPLYDHELVRKNSRTPALRLRFGKRDAGYGEEEEMASQEQ
ncbi:hypothetical protein Pmani_002799 [Petrolisthes manimaculis]|uniref:Uncharacterized protein n=1 Tax=Petrolisthes manimaculis TaxID=1843537 RepID=A0AAE1QJQ7_9EUCA|nr:hypothetical protein Pmani_002799 [Petrolisthes manimaculis]